MLRFTPDHYFLKLWQDVTDRRTFKALEEFSKKLSKAFVALLADLSAIDERVTALEGAGGVPSGGIIISLGAACPTGFTEVTDLAGHHIRGVPSGGTIGTAVGADSVNVDSGVGDATVINVDNVNGIATVADDSHRHYFSVPTVPLTKYVRFCQKD